MTIMISCSGVGMGNASRVSAILEALVAHARADGLDLCVHVFSWGSGYLFLDRLREQGGPTFTLHRLEPYVPPVFLKSFVQPHIIYRNGRSLFRNLQTLRAFVPRLKPDLILLDSDYHFPAYWFSGCPLVFIGQAHDVLERARQNFSANHSIRDLVRLFLSERVDEFVQKRFSHLVLVPNFGRDIRVNRRVTKIPLVVRAEFVGHSRAPSRQDRVGILLSGSSLDAEPFLKLAAKHRLETISPKDSTVPSSAAGLDQFDIVITQGGLSSISECIARERFMIVVPLDHHPEQLLNAIEVERLGFGIRAAREEMHDLDVLLKRAKARRAERRTTPMPCNGAQVAAGLIHNLLRPGEPQNELSRRFLGS